jgi:hypothetical protein
VEQLAIGLVQTPISHPSHLLDQTHPPCFLFEDATLAKPLDCCLERAVGQSDNLAEQPGVEAARADGGEIDQAALGRLEALEAPFDHRGEAT